LILLSVKSQGLAYNLAVTIQKLVLIQLMAELSIQD
jgi:hypothetical protein